YWGLHQWFYGDSGCEPNPSLGPTAWRVVSAGNRRFLRGCLSDPGSNSKPTIAADGSAAAATFGCVDSALISPLPSPTADDFLSGSRGVSAARAACIPRKKLRIRIRNPKSDPLAKITVVVRGGRRKRVVRVKP